jgi:tetratricopeptide (TPR) repeat protein
MRIKIFISLIILQCTIISLVSAETIVLKSGKTVNGKIVERTKDYIKIDFMGTTLTYWLDEIERIIESGEVKSTEAPEPAKVEATEYFDKTVELLREKKNQEAAAELEEIIQSEPKDIVPYVLLGTVYCNMGKFKEAIDILNKAILKEPDNVRPYMILTITYKNSGEKEKAKETLDKLISLYRNEKRIEGYFLSELKKDLNW